MNAFTTRASGRPPGQLGISDCADSDAANTTTETLLTKATADF
jgi:hypothetical protein